jgi:amino acid transporter
VVAVFICTLAVQANTARVLFAMARDRAVPGWRWLGRVHPDTGSPRVAAVAVGVLGGGLLVFNLNFEHVMTALVCVSIVWANLAYLLTTGPLLARRLRGETDSMLGRWGLPVAGLAVVWGLVLVVNIGWPRERLYGPAWYQRFAGPLFTAGLLAAGVVAYRFLRPSSQHVEVEG